MRTVTFMSIAELPVNLGVGLYHARMVVSAKTLTRGRGVVNNTSLKVWIGTKFERSSTEDVNAKQRNSFADKPKIASQFALRLTAFKAPNKLSTGR
jgi:hypothetical protein